MSDPESFSKSPIEVNKGEDGVKATISLSVEGNATPVVAAVFKPSGEFIGRTEVATTSFARSVQLNNCNSGDIVVCLYAVGGGKPSFVATTRFSLANFSEGKDVTNSFALLDNKGNATSLKLNVVSTATAEKSPGAASAEFDPTVFVFGEETGTNGADKFVTMDNDSCMGMDAPSLASLDYCENGDYPRPQDGEAYVILMWAQYHKPGYAFIARYSQLANKFRGKLGFVACSIDPNKGSPQKFIDDPAKKYSSKFPIEFAVAHDVDHKLKKSYADGLLAALSVPHAFLVGSDGKVVWHQDHSELGATVPQYMHLMEEQLTAFVTTAKVNSVGERAESESESDSDSDDGEVNADLDLDDLF